MKNLFWIWLLIASCFGCTPSGSDQTNGGPTSKKGFVFNPSAAHTAPGDDNLCRKTYTEGIAINPDPVQANKRWFTINDGTYKVSVDYGKFVGSFILKKSGERFEISTSDNYPECLSNKTNFSIASDGNSFKYDNKNYLAFEVFYELKGAVANIVVELSSEANYGMSVRK